MNAASSLTPSPDADVGGPTLALAALAAGVAVFLLVTAVVTELFAARIEFSLFVGLPAGVLAGLAAAVGAGYGLRGGGNRFRAGLALGAFGVAFLVVGVGSAFLGVPNSTALLAGVAGGAVAATVAILRAR